MIGVLRADDARVHCRNPARDEHVVESETRAIGRKARRGDEGAKPQVVSQRQHLARLGVAIEVGPEHHSLSRTELARDLLALPASQAPVERKRSKMRDADGDFTPIEIDFGSDHAALFEIVNQGARRDSPERQPRDHRDAVVAVKTSLPRKMPVRKARRVRDFVEQVPSAIAKRSRVHFLEAHDVAPKFDDQIRDGCERAPRAAVDEEHVPVPREMVEDISRRAGAEKQVPRKNGKRRIVYRQGIRSLLRLADQCSVCHRPSCSTLGTSASMGAFGMGGSSGGSAAC